LGPDDFDPIKVIGKGAFGEVRYVPMCDFVVVVKVVAVSFAIAVM